ncbi:MAG TPA: hypothetical protein VIK99_06145 [Thermaerobacter sp.]
MKTVMKRVAAAILNDYWTWVGLTGGILMATMALAVRLKEAHWALAPLAVLVPLAGLGAAWAALDRSNALRGRPIVFVQRAEAAGPKAET